MSETNREIVITGLGPVTSIGTGIGEFWKSLLGGVCRTQPKELAVDLGRLETFTVAAMPGSASVPGLDAQFDFLAEQNATGHRSLAYSLLACELALKDAALEIDRDKNTVGLIQVFEAPGVEQTVADLFSKLGQAPPTTGPPPVYEMLAPQFYNMQPFVYVHIMGKRLGLHGFSTGIHNACSSGAFALEIAAQRVKTGQADVMLVAGGEAFETGVRMEWFRRLDLYAQSGRMAPFDEQPTGFFTGEGAGALVVESAEHAAKRGARVYARYSGGGFAQQGWKQVIPDVRACRQADAIREALDVAGIQPDQVDLIVPHGTATRLSDGYEAQCLKEAWGGMDNHAVATAFKPQVGHLLAASGLIEMIAALLALGENTVPATLHTRESHCVLPVPIVTKNLSRPLKTVLKISTGFTGHDAATVFVRV